MDERKRIRLIAVGGTASGEGVIARLSAEELSGSVAGLTAIADVDAV